MQNYETRKHFEAALCGLARLRGVDPRGVRNEFKVFLSERGVIGLSTTELDDALLGSLADRISIYVHRIENTPPDERGANKIWDDFSGIMAVDPPKK